MASKSQASGAALTPVRSPATPHPHSDVERRLRAAFPEVWARYEWLLAARMLARRPRKPS